MEIIEHGSPRRGGSNPASYGDVDTNLEPHAIAPDGRGGALISGAFGETDRLIGATGATVFRVDSAGLIDWAMKAQPGGVIRFTTCGERRKYKPAAAVHTAPAAVPASSELRTCESFCAARSSASRRASNACIRLRIRSSAASSALDDDML